MMRISVNHKAAEDPYIVKNSRNSLSISANEQQLKAICDKVVFRVICIQPVNFMKCGSKFRITESV